MHIRGRGAEAIPELLKVGREDRGGEGGEGDGSELAPLAELGDGMSVGRPGVGVRDASGEELHGVERSPLAGVCDGPGQGSHQDRLAVLGTPAKGHGGGWRSIAVRLHRSGDLSDGTGIPSRRKILVKSSVSKPQRSRRVAPSDALKRTSFHSNSRTRALPSITRFMRCKAHSTA